MKYVQSFYPYAVTFASCMVSIPAKDADGDLRNICEVPDEKIESLQAEPLFRRLVDQKKYRVLNKLPDSYRPAAMLVNEARAKADDLERENAELKAQIEKLTAKKSGSRKAKAETAE